MIGGEKDPRINNDFPQAFPCTARSSRQERPLQLFDTENLSYVAGSARGGRIHAYKCMHAHATRLTRLCEYRLSSTTIVLWYAIKRHA